MTLAQEKRELEIVWNGGPWTVKPMKDGRFHIKCDAEKGVRPVMELILDPKQFDA